MSPRTFFVGILALVCGVSASVGVNRLRQPGVTAKPETVVVPVTAVAIKRGDVVTEQMLTARHWPKDLVPSGVLLTKDQIVGKIAQDSLVKGEPIYSGKIGDSPRFSGLVKPGMRAKAIQTPNDSSFVAGLIEPGDKVDVMLTHDTDMELTGGGSTITIMECREIMAIGQVIDPEESREKDGKRMRSVTLEVTPEEVLKLDLAQQTGTLTLALRSEMDEATADVSAVTVRDLTGTVDPVVFNEPDTTDKPKPPSKIDVRILRGPIRSIAKLQAPQGRGSVYINGDAAGLTAPAPLAPVSAP